MPKNDIVLLDAVLDSKQPVAPAGLGDDDFFEFFTFGQILKDHDLSDDELLAGQLGGGNEGGVDGFFVFEDGRLLDEDVDLSDARSGIELTLYLIQSKRSPSFTETALQKISDTLEHILDLSKSSTQLKQLGLYHDQFLGRVEIFRKAVKQVAAKSPSFRVVVAYASKGDTSSIAPNVHTRADLIRSQVEDAFPGARSNVVFYGARELYQEAQRSPTRQLAMGFAFQPLSDQASGHVALVRLRQYYEFLTDTNGALRSYVFEANVRDFGGNIEVNKQIQRSLEEDGGPQFWWLNNGVTIVSSDVRPIDNQLYMSDPLVVNGLQTSLVLYHYFQNNPGVDDGGRLVLVRVIQTDDEKIRDRVIRSTNNQTKVPDASLRATDQVQRDIENHFLAAGLYYDRRKNQHRNLGRPADKIIPIPYLAQALLAVGASRPHDARARPSSVLKDEVAYSQLFNPSFDLDVFVWAAKTMRRVDAFMRADEAKATQEERNNLRFHVGMLIAFEKLGEAPRSPARLSAVANSEVADTQLLEAIEHVRRAAKRYMSAEDVTLDRTSKSTDFTDRVLRAARRRRREAANSAAGS